MLQYLRLFKGGGSDQNIPDRYVCISGRLAEALSHQLARPSGQLGVDGPQTALFLTRPCLLAMDLLPLEGPPLDVEGLQCYKMV